MNNNTATTSDLLDLVLKYDGKICDIVKDVEIKYGIKGLAIILLFTKNRIDATLMAMKKDNPNFSAVYDSINKTVRGILQDNSNDMTILEEDNR